MARRLIHADHASEVWCPLANVITVTAAAGNRELAGVPYSGAHCLGPACPLFDSDDAASVEAKTHVGRCGA